MELKIGHWYYNPPSSAYDEGWSQVTDLHKDRYGQGFHVVEWDTYVMRDGTHLRLSAEELPVEVAIQEDIKLREATNRDLGLLVSHIFDYDIEIDGEL